MVIISLELTRVNPDRNSFSINVELTSTFLLYRGLVHHHDRILNVALLLLLFLFFVFVIIVFIALIFIIVGTVVIIVLL